MPFEPRANWFSSKCIKAQHLTGHLGVKHCFGVGRESDTKSRQTLNTKYDHKITGARSTKGNNLNHQLRPINDCLVIKEVGVQRQPRGLPRSSHP
ncbi:hypothetical protein ES332_A10G052400v1 [Gossypium tomentosum]|uniref:Uncharacterized protein n=1 Tax=Gossypium tomentosum TaxID=34277 RepID=A0A5D2NLA9_GOSTO|nr:hypothetical protein ES332_A10G052400v1 [Gossypium tomentosum]